MAEKLYGVTRMSNRTPSRRSSSSGRSADLGFSDALIRIGQLQQQGKGTARDPSAAVKNYIAAAKAGNFVALERRTFK